MCSSFVFRLEDLTMYKVMTGKKKEKPQFFLSRSDFVLPQGVSLIHAEYTMYYYPGGINFPGKLFFVLNTIYLIYLIKLFLCVICLI